MPVTDLNGQDVKTAETGYDPKPTQVQNQRKDKRKLEKDLRYRMQFEPAWRLGADKWNVVAPAGLDGTPNYVVPITRMATHTGVVSMRQSLPEVVPVPEGSDEKKLAYLLKEASAHVHRMTNMEAVLDQGLVDYAVLGNMVLQSFVEVPFKAIRIPKLDAQGEVIKGEFDTVQKRDWSRPKIGTRARSPWECSFDSGARTPDKIRRCWWSERISEGEFEELFANKPENDYINLKHVQAGAAYTFNSDGQLERIEVPHDRIVIDNFQDELEDSWRIYANGVLIWDVPLSSVHCHGKCTLSLVPNHHKYDKNGKTHALYGTGDPELLSDLDDLINATTNMFILNYKNKNTYVVGVEGAVDVDEIDFTSGATIAGKVSVQSLGQADLPEWEAFKNVCEEWSIQMVKKNYKRLEGEVAKTAYEAAQKKSDENKGMEYQIKRMESGGFLEYVKKHVSDVMEHLPVEEWADVVDMKEADLKELLDSGDLTNEDVILSKDGKTPVKIRHIERIRTRGKVYKEKLKDGKRSLGGLTERKELRGQDGSLPASSEYLHTRAWRLFKKIPDVYLTGKTILGQDDMVELGKMEQLAQSLLSIANLQALEKQSQISLGIDWDKFIEHTFERLDMRKEDYTATEADQKIKTIQENIKQARALAPSLLNPKANVLSQPPQGVPAPVPGGAPQPGASPAPQAAPPGNPL
jgi:hypothetical protein